MSIGGKTCHKNPWKKIWDAERYARRYATELDFPISSLDVDGFRGLHKVPKKNVVHHELRAIDVSKILELFPLPQKNKNRKMNENKMLVYREEKSKMYSFNRKTGVNLERDVI